MKNKMMTLILVLIVLGITAAASYADTSYRTNDQTVIFSSFFPEDTSSSDTLQMYDPGFIINEEEARFPGGDDAMESYFMNNIQYPSIALEQKIQGTVSVVFTINSSGYVDQVQILEEIGGGCEEAIMSAIYHMPRWTPKKQAGNYVTSKSKFSFTFKL